MRSRQAPVSTRVRGLVLGTLVVMINTVFSGVAIAAPAARTSTVLAAGDSMGSLATPVGLTAVGLGVAGMVAGLIRRRKTEIQPENQRKP